MFEDVVVVVVVVAFETRGRRRRKVGRVEGLVRVPARRRRAQGGR